MDLKEKSERYRRAILSGNRPEAARLDSEINAEIRSRYTKPARSDRYVSTILSNDDTPALQLYDFLEQRYPDWWQWDIETVEDVVVRDYARPFDDVVADKIQALKLLCNNQRVFSDWFLFNQFAVAVSGYIADFVDMKYPSPGMVVAAMQIMRKIRPEEEFGRDVKKMAAIVLKQDGIYTPPPTIFDIVKDEMEVSDEMKALWPRVVSKVLEMVKTRNYGDDSDDVVDIQARRLVNLEKAAATYSGSKE